MVLKKPLSVFSNEKGLQKTQTCPCPNSSISPKWANKTLGLAPSSYTTLPQPCFIRREIRNSPKRWRSPNYGCSKKAKIATIAKEIQIIRRMNLLKRRSHCADVSPHLDLFLTFSGIKHSQVFFQSVSWGSAFTFSAPPRTSVQALGIPKIRRGITHFWNKGPWN